MALGICVTVRELRHRWRGRLVAENDGTKTVRVTIGMIDDIGDTVDGVPAQTVDLLARRTMFLPHAARDDVSPHRCRFTAASARRQRGSFIWVSKTSGSPVIIPAR